MSTKEPETGFAGRWSRLKKEARNEAPAETVQTNENPDAEEVTPPAQKDLRSDEEILKDLGLPDPDGLEPGDDFKGFMSKAVPARLRNRALRKLWLTNPVLANLDELLDYGEDFTDAATVIENLQTAYQVGRGFADKIIETPKPLLDPAKGSEEAELEQPASIEETPRNETLPSDTDAATSAADEVAIDGGADPGEPDDVTIGTEAADRRKTPGPQPEITTRRRMRFRMVED